MQDAKPDPLPSVSEVELDEVKGQLANALQDARQGTAVDCMASRSSVNNPMPLIPLCVRQTSASI